ncbi:hypothetical protein ACOMHN_040295 [Nucella lapillus]
MQNHMPMAVLDLSVLQCALGEEGMWLEFRHMASYLILYSSHHLHILEQELSCVLLANFIKEQWVAAEQYFKVAL